MTELEQLSNFIAFYNREKENVGYTGLDNWLNEFGPGFLNSLKNNDSSADNTSNIISVNKLELASEIAHAMLFESFGDIVGFDEDELFNGENYKPEFQEEFNHLYNNAIKVIETCRTMPNSADNNKVEQLHSDHITMSKIESLWYVIENKLRNDNWEYYSDDIFRMNNLLEEYKTHRNTVSTAVKQKDDTLVNEEELMSKMDSLIWNLGSDFMNCTKDQERQLVRDFKTELLELFKAYQNSVLRPVKD